MNPIQLDLSSPAQIQQQAVRFAHFTDKVLGRLNRIGARLCRRCLQELQQCPEHYDRICAYHVELLARAIRLELDALYRCLRVDTLEAIDRSYQDWIRRAKNPKRSHGCPGLADRNEAKR
jgi:hypothetical protein